MHAAFAFVRAGHIVPTTPCVHTGSVGAYTFVQYFAASKVFLHWFYWFHHLSVGDAFLDCCQFFFERIKLRAASVCAQFLQPTETPTQPILI